MEKIIDKQAMREVWNKTSKSITFRELKASIEVALEKYKDSNEAPLEIEIRLKNQYLGKLY